MLYLSVGHSGGEVGASSQRTTEFQEVYKIMEQLKELISMYKIPVVFVPTNLKLQPRIDWVNERATSEDKFIELHMDSASSSAEGAFAFYYGSSENSKKGIDVFMDAYCEASGIKRKESKPDTSSRFGRIGVVRDTVCWAWLVELGFITNPKELDVMRKKSAEAVLYGLLKMFGIEIIEKESKDALGATDKENWVDEGVEYVQSIGVSEGDRPHDQVTRAELFYFTKKHDAYIEQKILKLLNK